MRNGQVHFEKEPLFNLSDPPQKDRFGTEVYATKFFWISETLKYAAIGAGLYLLFR